MQQRPGDPRVQGMFGGDRFWSLASLLLLWLLYAFVFFEVLPHASSPEIFWLLATSGGLVLLFNTAAILVMVAHLSRDRAEIYGLDLHYLDAAKSRSSE